MEIKRNPDGDLVEIDGKVRIQKCKKRRTEVATEELLADTVTHPKYQVGLPDASGNIVELGAPITFIDWLSPEWTFMVYALEPVEDEVNGETVINDRFMPKGEHATEELALAQAVTLSAAMN